VDLVGAIPDLPAMTTEPQYRRLPGRSGFFVRNSLWMSADHLLSVRRNPFSESYRRFYFTDIQAIVITELPNLLAPYGYGVFAFLIAASATLVYTGRPAWAILCALASLVAFLVSWRSADCTCYLQTSVSIELLPSLRRQVDAGKAVPLVKAEIERTQGTVGTEVLEAPASNVRAGRSPVPKPPLRHSSGVIHWIVFVLMLVRGAITFVLLKGVVSMPLNIVASGVGTVILLLLVLAAIQQRNSDLALDVRRLIYVGLAFYLASGLASFVVSIYIVSHLRLRAPNQAMIVGNPLLRAFELIDLIGFSMIGLVGLVFMWLHQQTIRTPPPLGLGNGE
jgi:hypothetical protein